MSIRSQLHLRACGRVIVAKKRVETDSAPLFADYKDRSLCLAISNHGKQHALLAGRAQTR